jgi:hypothetical protein
MTPPAADEASSKKSGALASHGAALLTISPASSAAPATDRKSFLEHRGSDVPLHILGEVPHLSSAAPGGTAAAAAGAAASAVAGAQGSKPSTADVLSAASAAGGASALSGHAVTATHALNGGQPQAENSLAESLSLSPKPQVFKPHQRIAPLSLGDDGWISFYDSPTMACADSPASDDENDSAAKLKYIP